MIVFTEGLLCRMLAEENKANVRACGLDCLLQYIDDVGTGAKEAVLANLGAAIKWVWCGSCDHVPP